MLRARGAVRARAARLRPVLNAGTALLGAHAPTVSRLVDVPLVAAVPATAAGQHKRPITAIAIRGGASVVGGLLAFVLFQAGQRMDWNQRRRIRNVLATAPRDLGSFRPGPLFLQRSNKVSFVREQIDSDPAGPIVITGPQGSGKTMILKRALAGRPHTVYLSLRATPVTSGDALAVALVQQMGYLLPPTELLSRAIFNRDMASGTTMGAEIDRALKIITQVLEEEKARG